VARRRYCIHVGWDRRLGNPPRRS